MDAAWAWQRPIWILVPVHLKFVDTTAASKASPSRFFFFFCMCAASRGEDPDNMAIPPEGMLLKAWQWRGNVVGSLSRQASRAAAFLFLFFFNTAFRLWQLLSGCATTVVTHSLRRIPSLGEPLLRLGPGLEIYGHLESAINGRP